MAALTKNGWCEPTRDDETTSGEPPAVGLVEALVNAPARGAVARQALPATARTWTGAVARAATRKILTFYPSTSDSMTAFSRQKCHETRAAIKPSLPFLEWLASSSSPGQCMNQIVAARLRHCYYHGLHAIDATPARRRGGVVSHPSISQPGGIRRERTS